MSDGLSQRAARRLAQAVQQVASAGSASWQPIIGCGVNVALTLRYLGTQAAGIAVSGSYRLLSQQSVGAALTAIWQATSLSPVAAGVAQRIVSSLTPAQSVGGRIVQVSFQLVANPPSTVTGASFTNPGNAAGKHDGVFATVTGSLTAATAASLVFAFPAQPNRTPLTITSVVLNFYYKSVGNTALTTSMVAGSYKIGSGASTTLFTDSATATSDFTAAPHSFDITAAIAGSWANVAALAPTLTATLPAAVNSGVTVSVDAVEVVVTTATLVQTP